MKRIFLPLIILVVVALGAVSAIMYFSRDTGVNTNTQTATTNTTVANANIRTIVNRAEEGDVQVNKVVTYRDVPFEILTAGVLDAFHSQTAPEGKEYVVLFTKPVTVDPSSTSNWLLRDVSLVSAAGSAYTLKEGEVVGTEGVQDSGYFWFVIDDGVRNFSLVFKNADSEAKLDLGF